MLNVQNAVIPQVSPKVTSLVNFKSKSNVSKVNFKAENDSFSVQSMYDNNNIQKEYKKEKREQNFIKWLGVAVSVVILAYFGKALFGKGIETGAEKELKEAQKLKLMDLSKAKGFDKLALGKELDTETKSVMKSLEKKAELAARGESGNLNMMLYGEPGGGKTEWVKSLGKFYQEKFPGSKIYELDPTMTGSMWKDAAEKNVQGYIDNFIAECKANPNVRHVLFIDEFDSFARKDMSHNVANSEKMQNVFKRIFDAMSLPNADVIMATNKASKGVPLDQLLDSAILSRIERYVYVPLPNKEQFASGFVEYFKNIGKKELVSADLLDVNNEELKKICKYLESPENKASFREMRKIAKLANDKATFATDVVTDTEEKLAEALKDGKLKPTNIEYLKEATRQIAEEKNWVIPDWLGGSSKIAKRTCKPTNITEVTPVDITPVKNKCKFFERIKNLFHKNNS